MQSAGERRTFPELQPHCLALAPPPPARGWRAAPSASGVFVDWFLSLFLSQLNNRYSFKSRRRAAVCVYNAAAGVVRALSVMPILTNLHAGAVDQCWRVLYRLNFFTPPSLYHIPLHPHLFSLLPSWPVTRATLQLLPPVMRDFGGSAAATPTWSTV